MPELNSSASLRRALPLCLALLACLAVLTSAASMQTRGRQTRRPPVPRVERAAETREEAYRANNLGVALLEQFKHREGAEQFRRALTLDPQLGLARINLAIALYNVPDIAGALAAAEEAARLAPRAPQPLYLLGLIAKSQNRPEDALAFFHRVLELDAGDVGANVQLGQLYSQQRRYKEAESFFRTALSAEPYNGTALYGLATALLRSGRREEGQRELQPFQALRESGAATAIGQNYLEQGRYAEAVASTGAEAGLVERATPAVTFNDATRSVLRRTSPQGINHHTILPSILPTDALNRFDYAPMYLRIVHSLGGAATLFDFDSDGDLDLFQLDGERQLLFRNDGGRLVDVTRGSGLEREEASAHATARIGLGAAAGDYDNDGHADLLVLHENSSALYRNLGGGRFAEPRRFTKEQFANYPSLAISAAFADVDHDGDLDIVIAGFADFSAPQDSESAMPPFALPTNSAGAHNLLLRNNGNATFTDISLQSGISGGQGHTVAVVPTDYDNRRDLDLLFVRSDAPPQLFRNLRDGTFRDVAREVGLGVRGRFVCVAAGDVNKDDYTDFFLGSKDAAGQFAMSDGRGRFRIVAAPPQTADLQAAQFLDYDNDGLLDLVAVSYQGLRVWRNVGDGWTEATARAARRLLPTRATPTEVKRLLASGDIDSDGDLDIFMRTRRGTLIFARNDGGNRQHSVGVRLVGKVSNRSAAGAKVELRSGSLHQKLETYAATPAPAPSDILFGLGRRTRTDAVRVLWPAGIVQAETDLASVAQTAPPALRDARGAKTAASKPTLRLTVTELDRKPSSCPYLYTWNGERFEFVTDFMGGGELGYWVAPGVRAAPDPDEYVRIRAEQLRPKDGRYELRITNELEEVLFLDRLELLAIAHPSGVEVYPNEGLGNPTSRRFTLYPVREARTPARATDEHGHDVRPLIERLDRRYPDDFRLLPVRGYAEEHALTLDLGDEEKTAQRGTDAATRSTEGRTLLLLTGWTDYAFSSDNVAAAQSNLSLKPPALQVKDKEGRWQTVIEQIGIPVGRPQTVTVDLTGKFLSRSREVRILTNMRIYWDEILCDTRGGAWPYTVTRLNASSAELRWRGFSAEVTPDGREPFVYDYARVSFTSPWKTFTGRYTREGDVRPLISATDDIFVISRPGDELALSFDAAALPLLPAGWTRTFLLYSDGFSKEMDINSASPDEVAPLPFHAMKSYPYRAPEAYPLTPARAAYLEHYNTRLVASPVPRLVAGNPKSDK